MISADLADKINKAIAKEISVRELEKWLVPQQRSLISEPNSADADAVSAIELGIAEIKSSLRTEQQFLDLLLQVVLEHQFSSVVMSNQATLTFDSTSTAVREVATQSYMQDENSPAMVQWDVG